MRSIKCLRSVLFICVSAVFLFSLIGCTVLPDEGSTPQGSTGESQLPQPKVLTDAGEIELLNAIQTAAAGREDVLAFIIYRVTIDHVDYSKDKKLALVWIALVDKETGLVQSGEPGLVIAHRTDNANAPWSVVFQADNTFPAELAAIPEKMLSAEGKEHYMPAVQQIPKDGVVYRGYKLPWTAGQTVNLTGSIGHVFTYKSCPSTCLYAFDFANGSMFAVRAAKAGTVKYVKWGYENGNTTNANYLVLEDTTTTPTTYQVYFHFAKDTIPPALRQVGAKVVQGQFLGNADDTGYSSGNHLHFHVHADSTSYWGNSVDIVFDEVTINGGRPRMCSEAAAYPQYGSECMPGNHYVSANKDSELPTGAITNPAAYSSITAGRLNVDGWMKDDTAVNYGNLYYNQGAGWTAIGGKITLSPFNESIDLCKANIVKGTFFLALKVVDKAGKSTDQTNSLTELKMNYNCPPDPPACSPTGVQVALYTEPDYQGTCMVFNAGDIPNLGSATPDLLNAAQSIEVGSDVSAILYNGINYGGKFELFQNGDADLSNNSIGTANAASLKVVDRIVVPEPPDLILPATLSTTTETLLKWKSGEGVQTSSTLTSKEGYSKTLKLQAGHKWNVGLLPEGNYTWTVTAVNLAGSTSTTQEFAIEPPADLPATHLIELPSAVLSTAVKVAWKVDKGADGIDHFELQYRPLGSEWKNWTATTLYNETREVLFIGKAGKTYEFRLRAVDLLGNAEQFTEAAEVSTTFTVDCAADGLAADDTMETASLVELGSTVSGNWCPAGEADWLKFNASAGDALQFSTRAIDTASAALLTLYGADGQTFIGEARPVNSSANATLDWTVPEDGTYYIKLTPRDARIGGSATQYEVDLNLKSSIQPGTLICGSVSIPALMAGAYALAKKVQKTKKKKGVGW